MPSQRPSPERFGDRLEASYVYCRAVMEAHSRSFTFATRLLPAAKRRAAYALYGFFRALDDLVDKRGVEISEAQARAELESWKAWLNGGCHWLDDHPLAPALSDTLERYAVPRAYLLQLANGVEADLGEVCYETFAELAAYCFNVASTVGLTLCAVLGAQGEEAPARAAELGVAMQLTNILRDVGDDFQLGRVYLPLEDMERAGYSKERLAAGCVDESFRALMAELITRARLYYAGGLSGVRLLSRDSRFAIAVAGRAYAGILDKIEARDYDVFSGRAHVSFREKLLLAGGLLLRADRLPSGPQPLPAGWPTGTTLLTQALGQQR